MSYIQHVAVSSLFNDLCQNDTNKLSSLTQSMLGLHYWCLHSYTVLLSLLWCAHIQWSAKL